MKNEKQKLLKEKEESLNLISPARIIQEAPITIAETREEYDLNNKIFTERLQTYGGIQKLESDSLKYAKKLRNTEEKIIDDIYDKWGICNLVYKKINLADTWDNTDIKRLKELNSVLGSPVYEGFIEKPIYAKRRFHAPVELRVKQKYPKMDKFLNRAVYFPFYISSGLSVGFCGFVGATIANCLVSPENINFDFQLTAGILTGLGVAKICYSSITNYHMNKPFSSAAECLEKRADYIIDTAKNLESNHTFPI